MSQVKQKVFSLPINPKLTPEFINSIFIPFLKQHSSYIFDLYFTSRIPPFTQDAMGEIFIGGEETDAAVIEQALYISNETGIPLSATFNNIHIRPSQENLNIFIENFSYLYEVGIKIATIPHTSWLMTGQIQKEFPELYVKNTILREITRPNEIVSLAKAGFQYINLDRDLMRDKDSLICIKEAKEYCISIGKPIKLSLLANEGCWGGCPIMPEHYHYNSTREFPDSQYFNNPISRVSCSKWDLEDSATSLKAANLPPWKEDWEEFLNLGIDVFKLHGREFAGRLEESMDLIHRWSKNEEYMFPQFKKYSENIYLKETPINLWRKKIKTCKFDCWNCNYCEAVVNTYFKKSNTEYIDNFVSICLNAIDKAYLKESKYTFKKIQGLSSDLIKHFLNNICDNKNIVYLEIGTFMGSTFFAATEGNDIQTFAIDNFSENVKPMMDYVTWKNYISPKEEFEFNWKHLAKNSDTFIEKSVIDLSFTDFRGYKPNVIFYDSDHSPEGQLESLNHILPFLDNKFILILDDANFDGVVYSSYDFINKNKLKILFDRKILTSIVEDVNSFWNGLQIFVLEKQ